MTLERNLTQKIKKFFNEIPVTAILGARQVGKSTLAKMLLEQLDNTLYLDLELSADRNVLQEPYAFFELNKDKIICLDEIQLLPNVFSEMRGFIDNYPKTKFLILGSSSPELLRQSSETLVGRIFYYELTPFVWNEISETVNFNDYWLKGGLPKSTLNDLEYSHTWIANYIKTFLERDIQQFGYNLPAENLRRLWTMIAHLHGQIVNYAQLSKSLGVSATTVKNHIDILEHTFMVRRLKPYIPNLKKRLIKAPKIYIRDTGILHHLLKIDNFNDLFTHPVYRFSWESIVIENVIQQYADYEPYFYRTSNGTELDLLLVKGNKKIAFEIKASQSPKLSAGFWNILDELQVDKAFVIAQVKMPYILKNKVKVLSLFDFLNIAL